MKTGVDIQTAKKLLNDHFEIVGELKPLDGEVDYNFYVRSSKNEEYTFKLSREPMDSVELDFQESLIKHLQESDLDISIPEVISHRGLSSKEVEVDGQIRSLRLHRWVPGFMLQEINPRDEILLKSWGACAAKFSRILKDFNHPGSKKFYKWNPSELLSHRNSIEFLETHKQKELAEYFFDLFEETVVPRLNRLRKSVNHNDLHEMNVLVGQSAMGFVVNGVIDFGDALYCETINELAIACAYACMGSSDPLRSASFLVKAYHEIYPLEEIELEVLFSLISARLMITVCCAAENLQKEPENDYLQVSAKPAWQLLTSLKELHPKFAEYYFRNACGLEPCPKTQELKKKLESTQVYFYSPIDISNDKLVHLDLSVGSLSLGNIDEFEKPIGFSRRLQAKLAQEKDAIGVGGYLESRPIYREKTFFSEGLYGAQWRTVHLGLDIWKTAGTKVRAVLSGSVLLATHNEIQGDYGGLVILRHQIDGMLFFTLYGHLSKKSVLQLKKEQEVKAGEAFAELGNMNENGSWPPHLHFQVIMDMMGNQENFPGVAYPHELEIWKSICPDPSWFIDAKIPRQVKTNIDIPRKRKEQLGRNYSLSYQNPLHIVRGYQEYLYAHDGRRYLDTVNNVTHVGHQHPKVVKAIQEQAGVLNTNTRYLHQNITDYSEMLLSKFPDPLSVIYFVNSGSEANELALRMAKTYYGRKDILAIEHGYHGNTNATIEISSYKFAGKGGAGKSEHIHLAKSPDIYRGQYRDAETAGSDYAALIKEQLDHLEANNQLPSAFIHESILSCGGQIVLPDQYLSKVYQLMKNKDILCIADEVQVGFGRVGSHFWGFELQDVVPDIVTLGKPIGNGHPLAAVVTSPKVAESFDNGMEYFNTFGGNPVSCAVGKAVLEIIEEEDLQQKALEKGNHIKERLKILQNQFSIIGDVRGEGLFLGIELVKNSTDLSPAHQQAEYLVNRMKAYGVLMSTDGPFHNVIKIKPPMCISHTSIDYMFKYLEKVFQEKMMTSR